MKCDYARLFIHDYIDGYLADEQQNIIQNHIKVCTECKDNIKTLKNQKNILSGMSAPKLNIDVKLMASQIQHSSFNNPLNDSLNNFSQKSPNLPNNGQHHSIKNEKLENTSYKRLSFSIAASILVAVTLGFMSLNNHTTKDQLIQPSNTQYISQNKNFNLVFNSPKEIENVVFTIILPHKTELVGHPGQEQVIWTTQLNRGKNILTLPIISSNKNRNDIIITKINYAKQTKIFRIKLNSLKQNQIT